MSTPDKEPIPEEFEAWINKQLGSDKVKIWLRTAFASTIYRNASILTYRHLSQPSTDLRWVKAIERLPPENLLVHCKTTGGRKIVTSAAKGEWDNYWIDEDKESVSEWLEETTLQSIKGQPEGNYDKYGGYSGDDLYPYSRPSAQPIQGEQKPNLKDTIAWMSRLALKNMDEATEDLEYSYYDGYTDGLKELAKEMELPTDDPAPADAGATPIVDKEVPEEIVRWINAKADERTAEFKTWQGVKEGDTDPYAYRYGCIRLGEDMYHKMQEIATMHMEVIAAAVLTTDKLRADISTQHEQIEQLDAERQAAYNTVSTQGEQIAGLLSALKERGEMYLAVQKEMLDYRKLLKIMGDYPSQSQGIIDVIRDILKKYPSPTNTNKDNG